jgi:tetrahydromethanopterin S-methyltransferase subunit H
MDIEKRSSERLVTDLFCFAGEQKVAEIGGIRIGGQPGENPIVLIGSVFHKGDQLLEERKQGRFDRERARERIGIQERLSRETGLPCMLDIVANSGEEFKAYIDFVAEVTEVPFAIDAWKLKPRLEAARYVRELGLLDRMLYNSFTVWSEDLEREAGEIGEIGVRHLVLVPFDDQDLMPSGRVTGLRRLMKALEGVPLESVLVDTSVMNVPATGICCLANYRIKEEFGLPSGSAPANGSYMWKEARDKWGKEGFGGADAAVHSIASLLWHDFLFYGPLTGAPRIFPAVAAANAILATIRYGIGQGLPRKQTHPLRKFFGDFVRQLEERK